jgi:hypothetical protein
MKEVAIKIEEVFKEKSPNMWSDIVNSGLLSEALGNDLAKAVIDCPQISVWHPEGSLYNHMDKVFKNAVGAGEDDIDVYFSILFHDIGKPKCMKYVYDEYYEQGKIEKTTFYNHDIVGTRKAMEILVELEMDVCRIKKIVWIISQHMRIAQIQKMKDRKVEELVNHQWLNSLLSVHNYDDMMNEVSPDTEWILAYLKDKEKSNE